MTENPRHKGIRLPWLGDDHEPGADTQFEDGAAAAEQSDAAATPTQADAAPSAMGASVGEASGPFLQDLVDAMRQITEQARDEAMAQLHASVAERSADLRAATELRAAQLRDMADADVVRIGEWEQGETQRIRDEAAAKVSARKTKLDAQLTANTASGEGAMSAVQARIDAFERELTSFFAQLNVLHDPVAFASAVKRMPQPPSLADTPPSLADTPAAPAAPTPPPPTPGPGPTFQPAGPTTDSTPPWPSEPDVATPDSPPVEVPAQVDGEEVSTQVLVTGLTSFGAITSFKQSLERVAGVQRVSMGLGTSGEFIFTAVHAVGFDLEAAIRTFEGTAQFVVTNDQLRVTVGSKD